MAERNSVTTDLVVNIAPLKKGVAEGEAVAKGFAAKMAGIGTTMAKAFFSPLSAAAGFVKNWAMPLNQTKELLKSFIGTLGHMVHVTEEWEEAELRLNAVMRQTGAAAGFNKKELDEMAEVLGNKFARSSTEMRKAFGTLGAFTNVRGGTFYQAMQASADLAAFMGTDLVEAVHKVALAMNDPVLGMRGIGQAIGKLTDRETEKIKQLLARGDVVGTQALVLQKIQRGIGGVGASMAGGTSGIWARGMNALSGLVKNLVSLMNPLIEKIAAKIQLIASTISAKIKGGGWAGKIEEWINWLWEGLGKVIDWVARATMNVIAAIKTAWENFQIMLEYTFKWIEYQALRGWNWLMSKVGEVFENIASWFDTLSYLAERAIRTAMGKPTEIKDMSQAKPFAVGDYEWKKWMSTLRPDFPAPTLSTLFPWKEGPDRVPGEKETKAKSELNIFGMIIGKKFADKLKPMTAWWDEVKDWWGGKNEMGNKLAETGWAGKNPRGDGRPFNMSGMGGGASYSGLEEYYKKVQVSLASGQSDPQVEIAKNTREIWLGQMEERRAKERDRRTMAWFQRFCEQNQKNLDTLPDLQEGFPFAVFE